MDKGLHTALDKIYKNVDIKTSNIIIIIIVRILYSSYTAPAYVNTYTHERTHARTHAHAHTHIHTHTYTHTHTRTHVRKHAHTH